MRKPFFIKRLSCWYVKDQDGKFLRLDPDEEKAFDIWERMRETRSALTHPNSTVSAICAAWMGEHQSLISKEEFEQIQKRIGRLCKFCGSVPAIEIRPGKIRAWIGTLKRATGSTPRHHIAAAKRVFKWAHAEGFLPLNPIASMPLPESGVRERVITPTEHAMLVRDARPKRNGKPFALYLIASHCGARPQQLRRVTAAHVHPSGAAYRLPWQSYSSSHNRDTNRPPQIMRDVCSYWVAKQCRELSHLEV